jgi:hypothetical protein
MKKLIVRGVLAFGCLLAGAVFGLPEAQSSPVEANAAVVKESGSESLPSTGNTCLVHCQQWCAGNGSTCVSAQPNSSGGCNFTCSVAKEKLPKPSEVK